LGEYFTNELKGLAKTLANKEKEQQKDEQIPTDDDVPNIDAKTIMQKYIESPLLLEKRKFDIRCYVLVASTKPLFVLYHHGYVRLSLNEYDSDFSGKLNTITHLTNNSVQKKHPDYYINKEKSIWSMKMFEEYLEKDLKVGKEKVHHLYSRIKKILRYTIICAQAKIDKKLGYFELLGCDILVDSDLNPYLLEFNTNPALFTDTKVQSEIIPTVVNKTLDIVMNLNANQDKLEQLVKDPSMLDLSTFEVLYNPSA